MSHWDFGRPAAEHDPAPAPADDDGWSADDGWLENDATGLYPITYERGSDPGDVGEPDPWPPAPRPGEDERWPADPPTALFPGDEFPGDEFPEGAYPALGDFGDDRRTDRGIRRWLLPVGITLAAAAVGASAVLLTSRHPHAAAGGGVTPSAAPPGSPSASASPSGSASASAAPLSGAPLTMTQARAVLAGYTQANNAANNQRSAALLTTVETGSSYSIDAGYYQQQLSTGAAAYPAFTPAQATYYIPRAEPAGQPKWFAVQVSNAFDAKPGQVTSKEYLLFTMSTSGTWRDAIEPYILAGASTPQVDVGTDGLATEVTLSSTSLAARPAQLPKGTALVLDGTAHGPGAVAVPANLADQKDAQGWRAKLAGATVTGTHAPATRAAGREFALRTSNGGALVFYTDAAELTITPHPGALLHLTVPGFYSADQALSRARIRYQEQFAAYDPPAGAGGPVVVAAWSGITGKG